MVAGYSRPIPTTVIGHLLGAPVEDHRQWAEWSDEVVQGTYPTQYRNERGEGLAGAHPEFTAYVDEQIRGPPGRVPPDDFITRLLTTEVDGRRLTDVEARTQLIFLFISGNETTRHLISNLTYVLVDPARRARGVQADRDLVHNLVEETLRHDAADPVPDADLHPRHRGRRRRRMQVDDKVAFGVASANRDETHFVDPQEFRLDRPDPRGHFGFGGGPHVCPGATLARLEARVAVEVLLDRVATMTLAARLRLREGAGVLGLRTEPPARRPHRPLIAHPCSCRTVRTRSNSHTLAGERGAMAELSYITNVSVDGYIEDAEGRFDWSDPSDELFGFITDLVRPVGTWLYGRRLYESMAVWETEPALAGRSALMAEFARVWQAGEKVVYSTTLDAVSTDTAPGSRRASTRRRSAR